MIGNVLRKVMWVGRVTTFCVGLVVVFSVVLGVGTTALAAVPGDPFKLGQANVVDRASGLFGRAAGALLVIDNNGTGSALDLRVGASTIPATDKAVAPMRVDSRAKVTNLNSDELDGKDAGEFYAAGSKVADSVRADSATNAENAGTLDGKDSTAFLATDGRARDSEKLNGMYSSRFMRSDAKPRAQSTVLDSSNSKTTTAPCRAGERAISGGAKIVLPDGTPAGTPVALTAVHSEGAYRWTAAATEMSPYEGDWGLWVEALCVSQEGYIYHAADGQ